MPLSPTAASPTAVSPTGWVPRSAVDRERLLRTGRRIQALVWCDALLVMLTSAGTVYGLLRGHGAPAYVAIPFGLMVDIALIVGLIGDRELGRCGIRLGWGVALRWITAAMTLSLNVAGSLSQRPHPDFGGAAIHAVPPILLVALTEAASAFQLAFTALQRQDDPAADRPTAAGAAPVLATRPADGDTGPSVDGPAVRPPGPSGRRPSSVRGRTTQPSAARRRPATAPAGRRPAPPPPLTDRQTALLAVLRPIAHTLAERGERITREVLRPELTRRGVSVPNADLGPVIRVLAAEPMPTPRTEPAPAPAPEPAPAARTETA